jgi:hypothetical protein
MSRQGSRAERKSDHVKPGPVDGLIPTAANHFHYPGRNAVESRPLIGTDHPPLVLDVVPERLPH